MRILQCLGVSAKDLLWLPVTVVAYCLGCAAQRALRGNPVANPVLIAIAIVSGLLALTHTPYDSYFRSTWLITWTEPRERRQPRFPQSRPPARLRANRELAGRRELGAA